MPDVTSVRGIKRCHIEAFKEYLRWLPPHPRFHRPPGATLKPETVAHTLRSLGNFFCRISPSGSGKRRQISTSSFNGISRPPMAPGLASWMKRMRLISSLLPGAIPTCLPGSVA
jgi:hypothetical protein